MKEYCITVFIYGRFNLLIAVFASAMSQLHQQYYDSSFNIMYIDFTKVEVKTAHFVPYNNNRPWWNKSRVATLFCDKAATEGHFSM